MSAVGMQDPIIQRNVVRAQAMFDGVTKEFTLKDVEEKALAIVFDALAIMRAEVRGAPTLTEMPTPIMVTLDQVSPLPQIQHSVTTLTSVLRAHRVAVELTWFMSWQQLERPVYTATREGLIAMAAKIEPLVSQGAHMERGRLISPSQAYYEVCCLKQAAKCLTPTDSIWSQFFESMSAMAGAAAASLATKVIDFAGLIGAIRKIWVVTKKEWIASWYKDLFDLEWKATNITTLSQFDEEVGLHVTTFLDSGHKYTLGLVKILATILGNEEIEESLRDRVFQLLTELVIKMPTYSLKHVVYFPTEIFRKCLKRPDRYAGARGFAAAVLIEMVSKSENKKYLPVVKEAINLWQCRLNEKRYIQEKREAMARLNEAQDKITAAERDKADLENQFVASFKESSGRGVGEHDAACDTDFPSVDELEAAISDKENTIEKLRKEINDIEIGITVGDVMVQQHEKELAEVNELIGILDSIGT